MGGWLRNNGLSVVLLLLFVLCLTGHSIAGWLNRNQEEALHSQPAISYGEYVRSGDFHESVAENWESEFLQMGMFVLLTVYLFQKGSSESKDPDEPDDGGDGPETPPSRADAPWPVRRGGLVLWAYSHSLSIAFFLLFAVSFSLHAVGGWEAYRDEARPTWGRGDQHSRIRAKSPLLVRVARKLAERISGHFHDGRALDLSARTRLPAIQTDCGAA